MSRLSAQHRPQNLMPLTAGETPPPPRALFDRRAILKHLHATPTIQYSEYLGTMRMVLKANRYGKLSMSHWEIGKLAHFSERTAYRVIGALEARNLVHKQKRYIPGTKRQGKNTYTFLNQDTGTAHPFTHDRAATSTSSAAKMAVETPLINKEKDLDLKEYKISEEDRSANLAAVRALIGALSGQMALGGA